MAMKYIKCPHCGAANGPKSINEKSAHTGLSHTICKKCHKRYSWNSEYGHVNVYKD